MLEINEKMEAVQQGLYLKLDVIQKCYQAVYLSLKDIYVKEKEARSSQSKFQEVLILMQKANVPNFPLLSYFEQLRGDIALKFWRNKSGRKQEFF
jgi:hypothetical protein